MNKIKLPSMVEFVRLLLNEENSRTKPMREVFNYLEKFANFLSQQPNISMFVPAVLENGEWRILEEPEMVYTQYGFDNCPEPAYDDEECKQYQTALDNVMFEGFEVKERSCNDSKFKYIENGLIAMFYYNEKTQSFEPNTEYKTLEDLTKYNLTLTATAQKEIGL